MERGCFLASKVAPHAGAAVGASCMYLLKLESAGAVQVCLSKNALQSLGVDAMLHACRLQHSAQL